MNRLKIAASRGKEETLSTGDKEGGKTKWLHEIMAGGGKKRRRKGTRLQAWGACAQWCGGVERTSRHENARGSTPNAIEIRKRISSRESLIVKEGHRGAFPLVSLLAILYLFPIPTPVYGLLHLVLKDKLVFLHEGCRK